MGTQERIADFDEGDVGDTARGCWEPCMKSMLAATAWSGQPCVVG
jgi:hypothetical protein